MKKAAEVHLSMRERRKGTTQELAAARTSMMVKTARRDERLGKLPSQLKAPRTWRTRETPFEEGWPWVVEQLERDPALQGATLFAELCQQHPGTYRSTQVRTLQRHIAQLRAQHGPEREVLFEQIHVPGERVQSDFTHMRDLEVTIQGQPFPHLVYHFVLTYSNVEAVQVCFGETFEALAEGIAWPRVNVERIRHHWEDVLRLAGSLQMGTMPASDVVRLLQGGWRQTPLGQAVGEVGRMAKSLHLLSVMDYPVYRRGIVLQLNRSEARHSLARATFFGQKGEVRQRYREGLEEQLGALGFVVNLIVVWNTLYLDRILETLRGRGVECNPVDVERLSPLVYDHISYLGHYSFALDEDIRAGAFHPLRELEAEELEVE